MQHERPEDDGGRAAPRNPEREQRHESTADRRRCRRLRGNDAFRNSRSHLLPAPAELSFEAVAHERRDGGAGPRDEADDIAEQARSRKHALEAEDLAQAWQLGASAGDLLDRLAGETGLQAQQDLADAVGTDHHHQELDAVGQQRRAEGQPIGAVDRVGPHRADQQSDGEADERIRQGTAAQRHDAGQPEQQDGKVFRRGEAQRKGRKRLCQEHHDDGGQGAADEGRHQRPPERLGRLAAPPHGVAVPEHGHIDRLAGDAKQDGGEGAAVRAGHIHRGQQHDGGGHVHAVGEGQGESDAHHQREPRQHADQEPDDDAEHEHRQIERGEAVEEPVPELNDNVGHYHAPGISRNRSAIRSKGAMPRGSDT